MSPRDEMLKEILSDPEIMKKYEISERMLSDAKCNPPYSRKIIEVLATIINENANNRTARQIYSTIKNIHQI
jgi:hypothetical protein